MWKHTILLVAIYFLMVTTCHAQEQITITTYYPSPFGSYDQLQSNRVAIGAGNNPAGLGDSVLDFNPLFPPAAPPAGNAGSIYYDGNTNQFFYHNGGGWVPFGGIVNPAQLVYYSTVAGVTPCQPAGTHVVGVLDTNFQGASMITCSGWSTTINSGHRHRAVVPYCLLTSGYLICH